MKGVTKGEHVGIGFNQKLFRRSEPFLYIFPTIALLGLFTYYPFIKTIIDSFRYVNIEGQAVAFAGLENYRNIFMDPTFKRAVLNTFAYVLLIVPAGLFISLMLALAANRRRRFSKLYETMYALPMAMSVATTALIFKFMLNPSLGIINYIFNTQIQWFADENYAIFTLSFMEIWIGLGFNFLFLLSAVRNVPNDLLESSQLEGARSWQSVRHMILPLISPTMFFLFCTNVISSMLLSSSIIILTGGGPKGATQSIIFYMYHQGFVAFNYSYAFASAIIGFILTFGMMLASFIYERRGVHYQ